jgi:hypothetical protein
MLGVHHLVSSRALRGKAFVKPPQDRTHLRVQITQSLNQLYGEGSG